jgi:glutathione-regulated potassium-efflux system ancillary protein KefC
MNHGVLTEILLLLAAAVVLVPVCHKLGLGSVLGYLIAGMLIGPSGFGLITNTESVSHVSELGVVFLLFIIGLELNPRRLWEWKMPIFGMGTAQIVLVTGLLFVLGRLSGWPWQMSLVAGLAGAMSSTAIASQILRERNLLSTRGGSSSFSILLMQDIAVVPLMALLPLLAGHGGKGQGTPVWVVLLVIGAVVTLGHYLLRHVFRLVAREQMREVFTALSLLLVVGLAAMMQSLGVSMALGAFLGGVLVATSEYRHAIETDIEPFKGLLLGLFFMSVGMSVDLSIVSANPLTTAALVAAVLLVKISVHAGLALAFRFPRREIPLFSLLISQVGEFAFVFLSAAFALQLLNAEWLAQLSATVGISMASTPLLVSAYDRWFAPRLSRKKSASTESIHNDSPEVLIAGFGRVGQIVGRLLYANRIRATVLDHDPDQIEILRQFGFKVYYGDATRLDLMEAAGARNARVLVVAIDDVDDSLQVVDMAQQHFPHLQIIARARNVAHVYDLIDRDVRCWERETFDSSLRMGTEVLKTLGWGAYPAVQAAHKFRDHNLNLIYELHTMRSDQSKMMAAASQAREDLEQMFTGQREQLKRGQDGWDIHPEGR